MTFSIYRKSLLVALFAISTRCVLGQDHIYSQFFNAPAYLNPALSGQFEGDLRFNLIYRNQWSSINGDLSFASASADYAIPRFGGGVGVLFTRANEGEAYLVKNNFSVIYSYSVGSDRFVLSFGIQAGMTNRRVDWNNLVFSDQIDDRLGYIPGSVSGAVPPGDNSISYFDPGAGINLVAGKLMAGVAAQHLNRPDESFTGIKAPLDRRYNAHLSYRFGLDPYARDDDDEAPYLIPSVVMYKQAKALSLSAGMQFKKRGVNVGAWYRGAGNRSPDAFVISLIFDIFTSYDRGEKIRFGVSHDVTASKLNYTNTSGTTEGSVSYEKSFPNGRASESKFSGLRCYDFY